MRLIDAFFTKFHHKFTLIRSIFLYLDRTIAHNLWKESNSLVKVDQSAIVEMGLEVFKSNLIDFVKQKLFATLLDEIERDRKHASVDFALLKRVIVMLDTLSYYGEFEEFLIQKSELFYQGEFGRELQKCQQLCQSESERDFVGNFLVTADTIYNEEDKRCDLYLKETSRSALKKLVLKCSIECNFNSIISMAFVPFCDSMKTEYLKLMYDLSIKCKGESYLIKAFSSYLKKKIEEMDLESEFINTLLHFKSRADIILDCFSHSESFSIALKDSFEESVNCKGSKPAELLAKFVDEKMKKGSNEDELEVILQKCITLFRFLKGKDTFEAFYDVCFAKRSLLGKSASFDAEASMIAKLRMECGAGYTSKLEGMLKDVDLSKDFLSSFKSTAKFAESSAEIDFGVNVLTTGYWPTFANPALKIPSSWELYEEQFRNYYLSKYSGRKLLWNRSLGNCIVKAHFPKGSKELVVSFVQALILEQFNQNESVTAADIQEATGLENAELCRNLQTLACGKSKVLEKEPKGREIEMSDSFRINEEFTAKLYRVKINTIQLKESVQEEAHTNEQVAQDRQYQIDAAVVRIMKARRQLSHNQLISELFALLQFPCKASDLKKRIESLIEREYIERDKNNSSLYCYVA